MPTAETIAARRIQYADMLHNLPIGGLARIAAIREINGRFPETREMADAEAIDYWIANT